MMQGGSSVHRRHRPASSRPRPPAASGRRLRPGQRVRGWSPAWRLPTSPDGG